MSNYTKTVYTVVTFALIAVGYIIASVVGLDYSKGGQFKVNDYLAILVAMGTFTYSYLGFKHNKEQRILSVTPHVLLSTINNTADGVFGFYIKNYGIAPAINLKFKMYFDGVLDERNAYSVAFNKLIQSDEQNYIAYTKGTQALSPNEGEYIFRINVEDKDKIKSIRVKKLLERVTIKLEYESILGQKFKDKIDY